MWVIGTAGHVDHGKSTLVTALTGIDPDRLKEEKKRQMTIDLGFAWLRSEEGEEIGIIDVPGHLDFIENMIAGIGGISAVLLVIAADEGVMPQTREHLAIISLLKISKGLVVLTKCDKVNEEWLEMVETDIQGVMAGSTLTNATIKRVSAVTGAGIEDLKQAIFELVKDEKQVPDRGKPFLAIDRVFTITGFGTVLTGTLRNGSLAVGMNVQIPRNGKIARIRGLQTHKQAESAAQPGRRTAVNLTGVETAEIQRGDILCLPGTLTPSRRWDAKIELLNEVKNGIRHNDQVKVFVHTAESIGRIRILEKDTIKAGESGWVQIEFEQEMVAEDGDRFIIRRLSPGETLGGGIVVNAHPAKRYRLRDEHALSSLKEVDPNEEDEISLSMFTEEPFLTRQMVSRLSGRSPRQVEVFLLGAVQDKRLICLNPGNNSEEVFVTEVYWHELSGKFSRLLQRYHEQHPISMGVSPAGLLTRLNLSREYLDLCLSNWQKDGECKVQNGLIARIDHQVVLSPAARGKVQRYLTQLDQNPYSPPSVREASDLLGEELYQSLLEQEMILQVTGDITFRKTDYLEMLAYVTNQWGDGGIFTVAEFRDHFQTSRKYALAFLEYLDKNGITKREGEGRRVVNIGHHIQNNDLH